MSGIKIISDSSCDLTPELVSKYNISVVPFLVSFNGEKYFRENIDITNTEFYKTMRTTDVFPKTSLPTIATYAEEFKKYTSQGSDVICFNLTSKFSGSHQSAVNAASAVNEEIGETKVYVVDSIQATCAQGAIVMEAAKMRDAGFTAAQIYEKINKLKETCIMYITVDSLIYLQRGGRVGKANALAGTLLNIKPIIVLKDGELVPLGKVRGRKKALNELAENIKKDVGGNMEDYEFFLANADESEEAEAFAESFEKEYGIKLSYPIMDVGVTIGAHIGPTAVGFGYIKKYTSL
ncbi:MAG: DegV family protein [Clostridiales bacterium]|jgi:DegV family protein with EDD domain|nr:DegV family protein [Clostridiales bacterium]